MQVDLNEFVATGIENVNQGADLVGRLFDVAKPGTVFSEPVEREGYTVITASEVNVGMGFGQGFGGGSGPASHNSDAAATTVMDAEEDAGGFGGGGGGGGFSAGRPVAAISIGPNGVEVEPIVDATKIALAFFTTLGSMLLMFSRMQKGSK